MESIKSKNFNKINFMESITSKNKINLNIKENLGTRNIRNINLIVRIKFKNKISGIIYDKEDDIVLYQRETIEQAFKYDIQQGYLKAVTDSEVGDLEERVTILEEKIIDADEVEFYDSIDNFPTTGEVDIIYVDNTSGKSYTWNPVASSYDVMNTNNIITGSIIQSTL